MKVCEVRAFSAPEPLESGPVRFVHGKVAGGAAYLMAGFFGHGEFGAYVADAASTTMHGLLERDYPDEDAVRMFPAQVTKTLKSITEEFVKSDDPYARFSGASATVVTTVGNIFEVAFLGNFMGRYFSNKSRIVDLIEPHQWGNNPEIFRAQENDAVLRLDLNDGVQLLGSDGGHTRKMTRSLGDTAMRFMNHDPEICSVDTLDEHGTLLIGTPGFWNWDGWTDVMRHEIWDGRITEVTVKELAERNQQDASVIVASIRQ